MTISESRLRHLSYTWSYPCTILRCFPGRSTSLHRSRRITHITSSTIRHTRFRFMFSSFNTYNIFPDPTPCRAPNLRSRHVHTSLCKYSGPSHYPFSLQFVLACGDAVSMTNPSFTISFKFNSNGEHPLGVEMGIDARICMRICNKDFGRRGGAGRAGGGRGCERWRRHSVQRNTILKK